MSEPNNGQNGNATRGRVIKTMDRDNLFLPEVLLENTEISIETVMQSSFDMIWNAAGWARSFNYDESGQYPENWRERISIGVPPFSHRSLPMNEQRHVETVEEFKLRIAAMIRGNPGQITGAPRPDPLLVHRNKRAAHRKPKRQRTR